MHINVIVTVFRFYVFSITESENLSNHQMVFYWHYRLLLGLRVNPTILLWVLNFLFLFPLVATDLNGALIQIRFIHSFIHSYIKYILPEHLPTFWLCAGVNNGKPDMASRWHSVQCKRQRKRQPWDKVHGAGCYGNIEIKVPEDLTSKPTYLLEHKI